MSIYDNFADAPNQIRSEGQEITIRFQRTSDTTARISWNIPPPAHGCSAENRAYDGIVITLSNVPANYISTSPKDGVYYEGDPTADLDLHAGSVLDTAYVVAALYHDKTTTFIDIDGIKPKTPYYVSGYAVDAVGRYHREGVHAYSLPTGVQSYVTEDYPAKHEIEIYGAVPVTLKTPTGLLPNQTYNLPIKIECEVRNFSIRGIDAPTYGRLVDEINYQFSIGMGVYSAALPPNAGVYYKNGSAFSYWDGHKLTPVQVLTLPHDPLTPVSGFYWYNSVDGNLYVHNGTDWVLVTNIIESNTEPSELRSYTIWFDGTTVRVWEDGHWCDYTTIISERNPQCGPDLAVNDYWFNEDTKELFKWNDVLQKWDDALVIYYGTDPNTLPQETYWFDEKKSKLKQLIAGSWVVPKKSNLTSNAIVIYSAPASDGGLPAEYDDRVFAETLWYDESTNTLKIRNEFNTNWDTVPVLSFPVDPRNRKSCDLWWNSSPSVNDLYVWEALTSSWLPVGNFYQQSTDPSLPPVLGDHTAWVNSDGVISIIDARNCTPVNHINSDVDPRNILDGYIWKDNQGNFYVYQSGEWEAITNIVSSPVSPYNTFEGMLWFNPITNTLSKLVSNTWRACCFYVDKSFMPTISDQWYNTADRILLEWNGSMWIPVSPYLTVSFEKRTCNTDYEKLVFSTRKTGCHESFEVLSDDNTLFDSLNNSVIYGDPIDGNDGVDAGPMYKQLGIGDDGSPDERRALHEEIRFTFGHPSVRVEITKQQLDICINNALLMLRKHSSYAYRKAMFFMDLKKNQQIYRLTNRCVGFNKIVDVITLHRTKAGAFKTAYSQNDNFAYAALQQLYTLGTFDMVTFHLTSAYVEELENLFASRIMYQWTERSRELKIYQVPRAGERVLVEAVIERTEQDLLTDRETSYWLKRWAIVEAKGMLAQIRGKFATLPGPNGSTTLNANDLQAQLEQEKDKLMEELTSGKQMQDLVDVGMRAHFVMG